MRHTKEATAGMAKNNTRDNRRAASLMKQARDRYQTGGKHTSDAYADLCTAIILQAMHDYIWARDYRNKHKEENRQDREAYPDWGTIRPPKIAHRMQTYDRAQLYINECENFFRGWWFQNIAPEYLTDADPVELIDHLRRITPAQYKKLIQRKKEEEESC